METERAVGDVLEIAKKQRNLILAFFVYLMLAFANVQFQETAYTVIVQSTVLVLGLTVVILLSLLAFQIYGKLAAVLFTLFCFVPLINIIVFLIVNARASRLIKSHGYRVGLAGADLKAIENDI